ncbi:hypothetical protein ACET3Z_014682 [Daucus carota]
MTWRKCGWYEIKPCGVIYDRLSLSICIMEVQDLVPCLWGLGLDLVLTFLMGNRGSSVLLKKLIKMN